MRNTWSCSLRNASPVLSQSQLPADVVPPLVSLHGATFYRQQPNAKPYNKPLFPNITFQLPADKSSKDSWSIIGPANAGKTTLLELLRGQHLCFPATARTYPYLSTEELLLKDQRLRYPLRAIQYVGFSGKGRNLVGLGTNLSARYESRQESSDYSLQDFLIGKSHLNLNEEFQNNFDQSLLDDVVDKLQLENLLGMPVSTLSNGQTKRARIARALLQKPELLMLDEPFNGLDPPSLVQLNPILRSLAHLASPRILLSLRPQDPIPDWITHLMYLGKPFLVTHRGPRDNVSTALYSEVRAEMEEVQRRRKQGEESARLNELPRFNNEFGRTLLDEGIVENPNLVRTDKSRSLRTGFDRYREGDRSQKTLSLLGLKGRIAAREGNWRWREIPELPPPGEPLVEMNGVKVQLGDRVVLGKWRQQLRMKVHSKALRQETQLDACLEQPDDADTQYHRSGLDWTVRRGERWAVIGPNGSGKTTLLSLITADNPKAYALQLRLFGRSRRPTVDQPGLSVFEIQSRIGQTSPEVHSFFPRNLSVRQTLESAYAETPLGRPRLSTSSDARINACLRWFRAELNTEVGPDPALEDEMLRLEKPSSLRYDAPGLPRPYRERRQEYFYTLQDDEQRAVAWADEMQFGSLTFSAQRLALFLRAIVAQADLVILDEAFSGMDDILRDKCLLFLAHGETVMQSPYLQNHMFFTRRRLGVRTRRARTPGQARIAIKEGLNANQALIVISHAAAEIPAAVNNFLYLPSCATNSDQIEARCVTGESRGIQFAHDTLLWQAIWDIPNLPVRLGRAMEQRTSSELKILHMLDISQKRLALLRAGIKGWKLQIDRIRRSLEGRIPTPTWQRLRQERHARDEEAKQQRVSRSLLRMAIRRAQTLNRQVDRLHQKASRYDLRIEKMSNRIQTLPSKIDDVRAEQQSLADEEGDVFHTDFARSWVSELKRNNSSLLRQTFLREHIEQRRAGAMATLKMVNARLRRFQSQPTGQGTDA